MPKQPEKSLLELKADVKFWKEQAYALSSAILSAGFDEGLFTERGTEIILDAQENFVALAEQKPEDDDDDTGATA